MHHRGSEWFSPEMLPDRQRLQFSQFWTADFLNEEVTEWVIKFLQLNNKEIEIANYDLILFLNAKRKIDHQKLL